MVAMRVGHFFEHFLVLKLLVDAGRLRDQFF